MSPVFPNTMHAGDVLLRLAGRPGTFKDYLRGRWQELHRRYGRGRAFEEFWDDALQHGGLYTDGPVQVVRLTPAIGPVLASAAATPAERTTLIVFPSIGLPDGAGANKPWLQELPDPVSKITWHAWVEVHPETAAKWQVANGDVLLLRSPHGALRAPVWITPGVRPDVLAVPTGQGHKAYGRYARDRSFNAFELLSDAPTAYGGRALPPGAAGAQTTRPPPPATPPTDARGQGAGVVQEPPLPPAQQL